LYQLWDRLRVRLEVSESALRHPRLATARHPVAGEERRPRRGHLVGTGEMPMRRTLVGAVVLLVVPALAAGGPLGLDLGKGQGLFRSTLPSLRQGLLLSYDSQAGSSALWWGTMPLRLRPNLQIDLTLGAQMDGTESAQWLPGVMLTWRPSEHFVLHAQWSTYASPQRWPWRCGSAAAEDRSDHRQWGNYPVGD
jgi:hypothetical protein